MDLSWFIMGAIPPKSHASQAGPGAAAAVARAHAAREAADGVAGGRSGFKPHQ